MCKELFGIAYCTGYGTVARVAVHIVGVLYNCSGNFLRRLAMQMTNVYVAGHLRPEHVRRFSFTDQMGDRVLYRLIPSCTRLMLYFGDFVETDELTFWNR